MTTGNPRYSLKQLNVTQIVFRLLSQNDIAKYSQDRVITQSKLTTSYREEREGSLYDLRMGPTEERERCKTCNQTLANCPGHFGRIDLPLPVIHPDLGKNFVQLLSAFCNNMVDDPDRPGKRKMCMAPLVSDATLDANVNLDPARRWKRNVGNPARVCRYHGNLHAEQATWAYYTEREARTGHNPFRLTLRFKNSKDETVINPAKMLKWLATETTQAYLDKLGLSALGENHAEQHVMMSLLVLPNVFRPPTISEGSAGKIHNDLTHIYSKIIAKCNEIRKELGSKYRGEMWEDAYDPFYKEEQKVSALYTELCMLIKAFYNNKDNACRVEGASKALKSISEYVDGKEGIFRQEVFAGRRNNTGRTVIVSDAELDMDQIGIPYEMADKLVQPMVITVYNIDDVKLLWEQGCVKSIKGGPHRGEDIGVDTGLHLAVPMDVQSLRRAISDLKERNEGRDPTTDELLAETGIETQEQLDELFARDRDLKEDEERRMENIAKCINKIEVGDVIERSLIDDDYVSFSRQPLLWQYSTSIMRIKRVPGKAIRVPDGSNQQFNADNDGDEMNVHVLQGVEEQAEAIKLMAFNINVLSVQGGKPLYGLIQDALLSASILTSTIKVVTSTTEKVVVGGLEIPRPKISTRIVDVEANMDKELWQNCVFVANREANIQSLMERCERFGINPYSGRGLFSILFPETFTYTGRSQDKTPLEIRSGVLIRGTLSAGTLNTAQNTIHHELVLRYGAKIAVSFISDARRMCHHWLESYGLTLGRKDLSTSLEARNDIEKTKDSLIKEIIRIQKSAKGTTGALAEHLEADVRRAANNTIDQLSGVTKKHINPQRNTILRMEAAGSKGSITNTTQMLGSVGQITIAQERPALTLSDRRRADTHFAEDDATPEARGACTTSYEKGQRPSALVFQGMATHQAAYDIAVNTGQTGYMQRKLIMFQIRLVAQENGSVTGGDGTIVQFRYGGDGLSGDRVLNVGGKTRPFNIQSILDAVKLEVALARVRGIQLPAPTKVFLDKFQAAKVVTERAIALRKGAKPYIEVKPGMTLNDVLIANAELEEGLIPGITVNSRLATGEQREVLLERTLEVQSSNRVWT